MLIFNAILLLVFDVYIFFALRATKIKAAKTKWFSFVWWGYSIALLLGLYISAKFNLPLAYRSVILVAFFMTAASKFIFIVILDRKSTRLNSSHVKISYAVFCLKKKIKQE